MHNLQSLEFVRVRSTTGGIVAGAKFLNWSYEYNFLVLEDGTVCGRSGGGDWNQLSPEATQIIRAKVRYFMLNRKFSFN